MVKTGVRVSDAQNDCTRSGCLSERGYSLSGNGIAEKRAVSAAPGSGMERRGAMWHVPQYNEPICVVRFNSTSRT